jgi:proline iminopeptidase
VNSEFPPIEPYAHGMLEVGDHNLVYWETCGNPAGKPALVIHGGPGTGSKPGLRRLFDPRRYLIALFDQRGSGRSVPHAGDPATDMRFNTTDRLVADIERIRRALGIDRWLLYGGSWGATLALRYAELFPERVSEMVLSPVITCRRTEIDWLYRGAGRFFPEAHRRFLALAARTPGNDDDVVEVYARLMEDQDQSVRDQAVAEWIGWETVVYSWETRSAFDPYSEHSPAYLSGLVRTRSRYFAHGAWLDEGTLIACAGRLASIPGTLIHGERDLSWPLATAWELSQAWTGSELIIVPGTGHLGSDAKRGYVLDAIARYATN